MKLREFGVRVEAMQVDLATPDGVRRFLAGVAALDRAVDLLFSNAGVGLGDGFLDQDMADAQRVIDTNIGGMLTLVHDIGARMRSRRQGRILFTGSITGFIPGTFQAVYNATKAFINSFSFALREELGDTGVTVTVTCLMPGPTDCRGWSVSLNVGERCQRQCGGRHAEIGSGADALADGCRHS